MDFENILESLFRWLHVVFGILWIGLLYFFNWMNAQFEGTLDADTKRKVIPELRPRALFWFRMGAALTWVTGVLLLLMVYYHGGNAFYPPRSVDMRAVLMLILVLVAPFLYDALVKTVLKDLHAAFIAGVVGALLLILVFEYVGGFGPRGYAIHLGGTFGTIMAFNVWFRIWPAQRKIITAIKEGQAPDAALVALAGQRSRHNTYMSVPLVFMMLSQHSVTWTNPISLTIIVLAGFGIAYHIYDRAAQVKGF